MQPRRTPPQQGLMHTLCVAVICLLVGTACSHKADEDTGTSSSGGASEPYDGPPVSFEEALTEVLVPSCGFDSCHGSGAGYLRIYERQTEEEWLEMNSTILITRPLIIPGDSARSYLIKKMEGSSDIEGDVMPPSGSIDVNSIGKVRSWIDNIETD